MEARHIDGFGLATEKFTLIIFVAAQNHIDLHVSIQSQHAWLNTRCRQAIAAKYNAEGIETYNRLRDACSFINNEEFLTHVAITREDMEQCARASKEWWQLNASYLIARIGIALFPY